jgi:hypothetical protein
MATATRKTLSELSSDELTELLGLIKGADSVELKVTLPAGDHRGTGKALGIDPLDAQIRQVYFFDTPDLALNAAGIAVRARRIQGRSGDTVVKLRPVVPEELPDDVRHSASMNVEVDAMPGGYVCSASMKGKVANEEVRDVITGKRPVKKIFSKEQRTFFTDHAPDGATLDELSILGPVFVLKQVVQPPDYGRRLVGEMWLLPDGSRIIELSTKCLPSEAFQVAVESRAFFGRVGLDLSGETQTKTRSTLEYFAAALQSEAKAPEAKAGA